MNSVQEHEEFEKIWRCDCMGGHFISLKQNWEGTGWLAFEVYETPTSFVGRVKKIWQVLTGERTTYCELIVSDQVRKEIIETLKKLDTAPVT